MSDFPYAAEAEQEITVEELEYLESKYSSEKESIGAVSPDTQFLYAWGLIRSKYAEDNRAGVDLLLQTMQIWPNRARECLYDLAVGNYRLREYSRASEYAKSLLELEPTNLQAKSLLALIESRSRRDGLLGMALVGGAAALAAGLVFSLIRQRAKE